MICDMCLKMTNVWDIAMLGKAYVSCLPRAGDRQSVNGGKGVVHTLTKFDGLHSSTSQGGGSDTILARVP